MNLHEIYTPITAAPFMCGESYIEVPPHEALRPYIRCFWGSPRPYEQKKADRPQQQLIVPDTCMDLIFTANYTENRIDGGFCGIDDRTFREENLQLRTEKTSTFAIRFYAWSTVLFAEDSLHDVKNARVDAGCHFSRLKRELEKEIFDAETLGERIGIAERWLLAHIREDRENRLFMETAAQILMGRGVQNMAQLAGELHVSSRQMERVFRENMRISPKKFSSLVRYQYLWQDILYRDRFDVQDAVQRYGYTDQAHLLNDFKRFHSMTPKKAREYARQNVGFLQENSGSLQ